MKGKRILKQGIFFLLLVLLAWFQLSYWSSDNDCNAPLRDQTMQAVKRCEYGIEGAQLGETSKPVPTGNQVLIKVRAASLNSLDVYLTRNTWVVRLFFGLRKPRDTRVGRDVAGIVEEVGRNVTQFQRGDEVFGTCNGALAEYAVAREEALIHKPANVSFAEAAAVPLAGVTALQGLRAGKVQAGQSVLINGATGGVGTFGVQLAKVLGAEVTAVCSTRNVDLIRSIGADHIFDYTKDDFTRSGRRFDVIFDNVGNHSISERRRSLTPKGICVIVGVGGTSAKSSELLGRIAANFIAYGMSSFTQQKFVQYVTKVKQDDLAFLSDLLASGKLRPVIEQSYNFASAPEALRRFDAGHTRGKLVVTVP